MLGLFVLIRIWIGPYPCIKKDTIPFLNLAQFYIYFSHYHYIYINLRNDVWLSSSVILILGENIGDIAIIEFLFPQVLMYNS